MDRRIARRHSLLLALAVVLLAVPAQAQDTEFTVTLATKTSDHPYFGMGHPAGYVIDGEEANELTLVRGATYTFQMEDIPGIHPFYISTSEAGGGAEVFEEGVEGNFATGDDVLTFTVPLAAPDLLWYQCQVHQFMGWRLNIVDATDAEEGAQPSALALSAAYPNPFFEATRLDLTLATAADVTAEVFDRTGRRVAVLHDGALAAGTHPLRLEAADLADGAYLVRVTAGEETVERRVTLVR